MNILFEDNKKVIPISLETLRETQTLRDYAGKLPSSAPVEHFEFIQRVQDILSEKHMVEQEPIWITNAAAKRVMVLDPNKVGEPKSWLIQRLVTRMSINDPAFVDDNSNMNVAVGYNDQGIQVAFGRNVRICQNQCIFGGRFMTTYGRDKMPYEKMIEVIKEYTHRLEEINESDMALLNAFMDTPVNGVQLREMVGDVHLRAVRSSYFPSKIDPFALNIGQVSEFSKLVGEEFPGLFDGALDEQAVTNLYWLYNNGTRILKPDKTNDLTTLWPNINMWGEYINSLVN